MNNYAIIEDVKVHAGDYAGFKADIEQYARIERIMGSGKSATIVFAAPADGFEGYAAGCENWSEDASRCFDPSVAGEG